MKGTALTAGFKKQFVACVLSLLMGNTTTPVAGAQGQQGAPANSSGPVGQGVPLTEQELNNLVSSIALYPDALVAQILAASTFPDQVAVADNWLQQNKSLTGSALMQAVNGQSWDPSVKALTQFPSVLNNMAQEPGMDIAVGRGVSQSAVASDVGHSEFAPAGQSSREPEEF